MRPHFQIFNHKWIFLFENRWKTKVYWDFPVSSVVTTLCFYCKGPGFNSWLGNQGLICYTCAHAGSLIRVRLFVTLWTVAHQAPLSMGFSRQQYWSGLPFPSPGHLALHCRQILYCLSHQGSPWGITKKKTMFTKDIINYIGYNEIQTQN